MNRCAKHPKYKGKRLSKRECFGCLEFYLSLHNKPRLPIPYATIKFKDKSKYSRKKKHKTLELDN